jgi:uncharacterized protein (TIGR02588 family)
MKVEKNWLEWTVFGLSSTLIVTVLALLVFDAAHAPTSLPEITVELGEPVPDGAEYVVPVTVRNEGERTVQELELEVLLPAAADAPEERARVRFPYVARRTTQDGWARFVRDPRASPPRARVLGFSEP